MSGSILNVRSHIKDLCHCQVYVYPIGDISVELYQRIFNFLKDNSYLIINTPKEMISNSEPFGPVRVMFQFEKHLAPWSYSVKYNRFNAYKQLAGLIGVAHCTELSQVPDIHEAAYSLYACYKGASCYSICIVFFPTNESCSSTNNSSSVCSLINNLENAFSRLNCQGYEYVLIPLSNSFSDDQLDDIINYNRLEEILSFFSLTINYTLDARRKQFVKLLSKDNLDTMTKLSTPFDEEDFEDKDRRTQMKLYKSRICKYIGDLSLQCCYFEEAFHYYNAAQDLLKSTHDWIWTAGSLLGLAAVAYLLEFKDSFHVKTFTLPLNFCENQLPLSNASIYFKDSQERLFSDDCRSPPDFSNDIVMSDYFNNNFADEGKGSFPIDTLMNAIHSDSLKGLEFKCDFIVTKFSESISFFNKAGTSGCIPQIETLLMLTRFLIEQNRILDAHQQLRKIMEIKCNLCGLLKMELLSGIASIYSSMRFKRHSSIFYKWAVTCCGRDVIEEHAIKAYKMLELSFPGYHIDIRCGEIQTPNKEQGWPLLQGHLLYIIFNICRMLKNERSTLKHLHMLLNYFNSSLSNSQIMNLLLRYKKRLKLIQEFNSDSEFLFQLKNIPVVRYVRPSDLIAELLPLRNTTKFQLNMHSMDATFQNEITNKINNYIWIQGYSCPTSMTINNPLPIHLEIKNLKLITNGLDCELGAPGVFLPPFCDHSVELPCRPLKGGVLRIIGYSYELFDIHNTVYFSDDKSYYEVNVIPYLPLLNITVDFPCQLLDGERLYDYEITLDAIEGVITYLEPVFEWHKDSKQYLHVEFDQNVINRIIPLTTSTTRALPITLLAKLPSDDRVLSSSLSNIYFNHLSIKHSKNSYFTKGIYHTRKHKQISILTPSISVFNNALFTSINDTNKFSDRISKTILVPGSLRRHKKGGSSISDGNYSTTKSDLTPTSNPVDLIGTPELQRNDSFFKNIRVPRKVKSFTNLSKKSNASNSLALPQDYYDFELDKESVDLITECSDNLSIDHFFIERDSTSIEFISTHDLPLSREAPAKKVTISRKSSISVHEEFPDRASSQSQKFSLSKSSSHTFNSSSSGIFGSVLKSPIARIVFGKIIIAYSGQDAYKYGYYRQCIGDINFLIQPSFSFGYFDIIKYQGNDRMCSFCFSVFNISNSKITLSCTIQQDSVLEVIENTKELFLVPDSFKRLQIDLYRFYLNSDNKEIRLEDELTRYTNHLTNLISFSWILIEGENERQGSTSLERVNLTEEMFNTLKIEPICFDLQVNEECILPEDETKFLTGQLFSISVTLSNYTDTELGPFKVQLIINDENGKEVIDSVEANHVVICPEGKWAIESLKQLSRYTISCNLVFFYHGSYNVKLICYTEETIHENLSLSSLIERSHLYQVHELSSRLMTDKNLLYFNDNIDKTLNLLEESTNYHKWFSTNFLISSPVYTFDVYHKAFMALVPSTTTV